MTVAILVPVLARPHRVRPLVASIRESARFVELLTLFLVSPGDDEELAEIDAVSAELLRQDGESTVERLVVDWPAGPGDYARKINLGAERASSSHEFLFLAADDLVFQPGWIERALAAHLETGACVVGTNDLGNGRTVDGSHSTHTLVHRDYLDCGLIDAPDSRRLLYEGYDHNFCDTEFVATAMWRETWAHATDAIVEHEHPFWRKAPLDETYEKGQAHFQDDQRLHRDRARMWQ